MGYYSTISGNISGITSKGYNSIKEDLKSVFDEADWDECNGGTLMIHSNAKHYDDYTHPVYDKIAAVLSAKEGHGELEEQGEESGDTSMIFFVKDNWQQLWVEITYPKNPYTQKTKVQPMEFINNGRNEVLNAGDFHISYNFNPSGGYGFFQADNDSDETALVNLDDKDNKFRILNGDFRKEYKELAPKGFKACLEFYNSKSKECDSSWST